MRSVLRRFSVAGAVVALASGIHPGATAAQSVFGAPALRDYAAQVLNQNFGRRALEARLEAAERRVAPAGALPDPMLTIGAMAVPITSFDVDREPMTQFPIMVQQRFPFPGKQAASTAVAQARAAVAEAEIGVADAALAAAAVRAYFALAETRTALEVWRGRVALADQAIAIAQVRYETGVAAQTDLLRARLRRAELSEQRRELEAAAMAATSRLDALRAGQGPEILTPVLTSTTAVPGLRGDSVPPAFDLRQRLNAQNPSLRSVGAEVERARRTERVFAIAGRPDFTVGLQGGTRPGGREPFFTALLGISVPLYAARKQGPAAEAARLDHAAATRRYDDLAARLAGEADAMAATIDALREQILQTADEVIPLAETASASALQRYRVGALEFSAVLDAQDDLFRAQLRLARLITDYATSWGELAALVGEEWYR